jgi:hypothetical protein
MNRMILLAVLLVCSGASAAPATRPAMTLFDNARIGFGDGQQREIRRDLTLPVFRPTDRLVLEVDIDPDQDAWDRAGSLHLVLANGDRVQLMPFVTGFMGDTDHTRDITSLAPLLAGGPIKIEAFIDTWVKDAWRFSASIRIEPGDTPQPTWAAVAIPLDTGWSRREPKAFAVDVPSGLQKLVLTYFATGHHRGDQRNSDEFHQRRHHLSFDGREVWTHIPWRTDGPRFRHVNPRSGRWDRNGDGKTDSPYPADAWSSDFPRSGWVPGDQVHPFEIDLTKHLGEPGRRTIALQIDDIDKDSFWRVSAYLSGWSK